MGKTKELHTQVPHNLGKDSELSLKPLDRNVYLEMRNCLVDYSSMKATIATADIARKLNKHRDTIQKSINKLIQMGEIEKIGDKDNPSKRGKSPVYKFKQTKWFEMFSKDFVENHRDLPDRGVYIALQEIGKKVNDELILLDSSEEIAKQIGVSERGLNKTFQIWEDAKILTTEQVGRNVIRRIKFDKIGQAFLTQVITNTSDIEMIKDILLKKGIWDGK